eukprot:4403908-Pleurochrysis_carterae.AAC.1
MTQGLYMENCSPSYCFHTLEQKYTSARDDSTVTAVPVLAYSPAEPAGAARDTAARPVGGFDG